MDIGLFLSTFFMIFLAELPDKTAIATLMMATRGRAWPIFLGVAAAFLVQTAFAVTFGRFLASFAKDYVRIGAGMIFLVFAFIEWRKKYKEEEEKEARLVNKTMTSKQFFRSIVSSFLVIFVAEWGDLTQLATASLAARYSKPWTIFISSVLALWSVTAIAIFVGWKAKAHILHQKLQKLAALVFAAVGVFLLINHS